MRGLKLYRAIGSADPRHGLEAGDDLLDPRIHARSRFRSQADPTRLALYTVHDAEAWAPVAAVSEPGDHTLIVVREFRRVPLHASALVMLLVTARAGCSAPVLALARAAARVHADDGRARVHGARGGESGRVQRRGAAA
jgi:hypothetical protein